MNLFVVVHVEISPILGSCYHLHRHFGVVYSCKTSPKGQGMIYCLKVITPLKFLNSYTPAI